MIFSIWKMQIGQASNPNNNNKFYFNLQLYISMIRWMCNLIPLQVLKSIHHFFIYIFHYCNERVTGVLRSVRPHTMYAPLLPERDRPPGWPSPPPRRVWPWTVCSGWGSSVCGLASWPVSACVVDHLPCRKKTKGGNCSLFNRAVTAFCLNAAVHK